MPISSRGLANSWPLKTRVFLRFLTARQEFASIAEKDVFQLAQIHCSHYLAFPIVNFKSWTNFDTKRNLVLKREVYKHKQEFDGLKL